MNSVLVIGGFDPSGGAGIQADIEACTANAVHAVSIISAITVQDTHKLHKYKCVDQDLFKQQLDCLLGDVRINVVKLGLIACPHLAVIVADYISRLELPVVVDPVLGAGGANSVSVINDELLQIYRKLIIPQATLITPNLPEAQLLAAQDKEADAAKDLLVLGAKAVLISGGHSQDEDIINRFYTKESQSTQRWTRLPHQYHGSGCTLAASAAAFLAKGLTLKLAVSLAQAYTYDALVNAYAIGDGQLIPARHLVS